MYLRNVAFLHKSNHFIFEALEQADCEFGVIQIELANPSAFVSYWWSSSFFDYIEQEKLFCKISQIK